MTTAEKIAGDAIRAFELKYRAKAIRDQLIVVAVCWGVHKAFFTSPFGADNVVLVLGTNWALTYWRFWALRDNLRWLMNARPWASAQAARKRTDGAVWL